MHICTYITCAMKKKKERFVRYAKHIPHTVHTPQKEKTRGNNGEEKATNHKCRVKGRGGRGKKKRGKLRSFWAYASLVFPSHCTCIGFLTLFPFFFFFFVHTRLSSSFANVLLYVCMYVCLATATAGRQETRNKK
ncbi:hypothetical protein QBC46DRAFT_127009 [Diplogelasinospora grovesii]|uniref:Uncharacterized protein n=1 Tax=Diplogelasinospora grovesii TaxID=303347 RepID=A0AAN6N757_9PEZI|nr:hypothetical protein QBC46DRAFT_127009 [Diplogelasinospora grovesii]